MEKTSSWEMSPGAEGNREIATLHAKVRQLEMRLHDLEARIPNSNIVSHNFWSRALAVFGHQLAIGLLFYAIIFAIAIVFGILGAIVGR
jgi:hypothetical protein